jgi:DNA-binding NarL/FixJ family response regulator
MIDAPERHNIRQTSTGAPVASRLSIKVDKYIDQQAGPSPLDRDTVPHTIGCIAVIDEYAFTRGGTTRSLQALGGEVDIVSFANCDEACQSHRQFSLIIYHYQQQEGNFGSASWRELIMMAPTIVLSSNKGPDFILDALEKGMRGYIPIESTTLELAVEIFRMVMAGGSFVPLAVLPFRAPAMGSGQLPIPTYALTPREKAVLALLKRGKANKIIAYELKMSESTAKVHIRNIMRKMNVSNRTEIVSRVFVTAGISLMISVHFVAVLEFMFPG